MSTEDLLKSQERYIAKLEAVLVAAREMQKAFYLAEGDLDSKAYAVWTRLQEAIRDAEGT